ncbi:hypothetical protein FVEN_g11893 [Fusarium venenatum]|nr:hypothetical protein FVEN_g11893 [Fusarium venenatum]
MLSPLHQEQPFDTRLSLLRLELRRGREYHLEIRSSGVGCSDGKCDITCFQRSFFKIYELALREGTTAAHSFRLRKDDENIIGRTFDAK